MDYDLDRSVRLLEDSLSSKSRRFLLTGTPKSKEKLKGKNADLSITTEPQILMQKDNRNYSTHDNTFNTLLDSSKTITGSVLRVQEPWKSTAISLYLEFYEVLQSYSTAQDVFDTVTDLGRCCSDALQVIRGLKSQASVEQEEEELWLENERNTWRLMFILYQDRLSIQSLNGNENNTYFGVSEKLCILSLFQVDNLLRESQLVIDWLEYSAAERDKEILHFTDSSVGWENTLHQLQSAETIVFESLQEMVASLHPDAPHAQQLSFHDLDVEDDRRLSKKVFQQIRCGKLDNAKRICINSGHSWRAALLEGWRLYHNPNNQSDKLETEGMELSENEVLNAFQMQLGGGNLLPVEGNETRDIWKNMAFEYCRKNYLSVYERAAVAAYCGSIDALLLAAENWEDCLWAHMRVLVDIRVESEIRDSITKNYQPLPEEYWNQRMSLNEVFNRLETSNNSVVSKEARMDMHIIQKYIILDDIPTLMEVYNKWLEEPHLNTQFLRFSAHMVLFLEEIGQIHSRDVPEKILELYVNRLCEMHETALVAFYVSKLGSEKQVFVYAAYLEPILDNEERKEALSAADDNGLNTQKITKQVVENIRNRPHETTNFGDLQPRLTEVDFLKVSAIDWLLIYETQSLEALEQTNAIIFTFLTLQKLDGAQLAFNKIPLNALDGILLDEELSDEMNKIIKEFLSYKAYLDAQEAFNEWFKQYNAKPIPPLSLPENAPFTEKVAQQHRESQFKAEMDRWKLSTSHLAKTAKMKLYNVLLFPDGGWLSSAKDCEYLRSTCIPEVVFLLYSVLYESEAYEECVQLADIIASEKYGLYKVFSKSKLSDFLVKLCESSAMLLNLQKDPWGNVTTD